MRRGVDWSFVVVVLLAMSLGGLLFTAYQVHALVEEVREAHGLEATERVKWQKDFTERYFEETKKVNGMFRWWERAKDRGRIVAVEEETLNQLLQEMTSDERKDQTPAPRRN